MDQNLKAQGQEVESQENLPKNDKEESMESHGAPSIGDNYGMKPSNKENKEQMKSKYFLNKITFRGMFKIGGRTLLRSLKDSE